MSESREEELERALKKGALVNTFGVLAKLSFPIFFLVVTWTLGPAITGVFSLAFFAGELIRGFAVTGYMDGAVIYASRAAEDEADGVSPERVVGAALTTTLTLSVIAAVVLWPLVGWGVAAHFSEYEDLATAIHLVLLSLPAMAVLNVGLAATKARMLMHYEVLVNGLARPIFLTLSAVGAWLTETGLVGLMVGYLVSHLALAGLGLFSLGRCYRLGAVLRGMRGRAVPALHRWAIPQSLNVTLNNYQTRIDAWLLGVFSVAPTMLALYTTAALITSSLREVRIVFSTSLGPVAARHHAAGQREALEAIFNRITRWTTALIIPIVLTVLLFRDDVLVAIDEAYRADTTFMVVLLLAPLTSCLFDLAGPTVAFTGHSRWNLFNAVLVSIVNTAISYALIPAYGLLGAAIGTAVASLTLSFVSQLELGLLEGIRLRARDLFQPYLAAVPLVILLALTWDPADLPLPWRGALWLGSIVLYLGVLRVSGMPELTKAPPAATPPLTSSR